MWREHAPYQSAIDVTSSENKIYVASPYTLFSIDRTSKEIERISKVSGLSETGVSRIQFDPVSKKLIVAFSNSNIEYTVKCLPILATLNKVLAEFNFLVSILEYPYAFLELFYFVRLQAQSPQSCYLNNL